MTKSISNLMLNGQEYIFKEYEEPITTPGIYHNSDLGLISLSSDGQNWITITDKNLGASVVYNYGDALSESNCGGYFQWGNNYMFPFSGSITTDTTQVDASNYGPGNYYESSTFIAGSENRAIQSNSDLWGNITNTLEARRGPCSEGYHIPIGTELSSMISTISALGLDIRDGSSDISTYLKMPCAGERWWYTGSETSQGGSGSYWASNMYAQDLGTTIYFRISFGSDDASVCGRSCSLGMSIRPFKNEPAVPTTDWTAIYQSN